MKLMGKIIIQHKIDVRLFKKSFMIIFLIWLTNEMRERGGVGG